MNECFMKIPHRAMFVGLSGSGKTHMALDLLENEYRSYFENIVIICPTICDNKTYLRPWLWEDENVIILDTAENLHQNMKFLSDKLKKQETLFLIDDCAAEREINLKKSELHKLATSGRHRFHSVWILTQRYNAIPLDFRDEVNMLFCWYPKNRNEFKLIFDENNVVETFKEMLILMDHLKCNKYACLYMKTVPPTYYKILST